jgi:glutamine cyclotransferase
VYTYRIVNTYPHDNTAFTQGLLFADGILYEGTGLHGRSTLRKVALETGDVLQRLELPRQFFGEGIAVMGNRVYQLTWRSRVGFVYDKESFALLRQFNYSTEGWGLTHDHRHLIMSDGSATLRFLDPETFAESHRVAVGDFSAPVRHLNELEHVRGEIYANVWQTDRIARIAPRTGQVLGWIELEGLLGPEDRARPVDALNGIAYDEKNGRLFVTGKWWPKLFEIELIPLD